MSNRRDFLKQLGLLSLAVAAGPNLVLPALKKPSLLTQAQKDALVRAQAARAAKRVEKEG